MAVMDLSAFERFTRTFEPGEVIFSEFEPGSTFYLIQAGRVQLVKITGGIERALDILNPSEMFGEMAILENSPRSATAIALDKVEVLEFNTQNFEILMTVNPQIALKLLKVFIKRIYDSKRRFMILALDDPQIKIADVFLMLDETLPDVDRSSNRREFKISLEDLARWAGMSIQHTQDAINHYISQRQIDMYTDRIIIKNLNEIQRIVSSKRRLKPGSERGDSKTTELHRVANSNLSKRNF